MVKIEFHLPILVRTFYNEYRTYEYKLIPIKKNSTQMTR
jgi:hypothetical protein